MESDTRHTQTDKQTNNTAGCPDGLLVSRTGAVFALRTQTNRLDVIALRLTDTQRAFAPAPGEMDAPSWITSRNLAPVHIRLPTPLPLLRSTAVQLLSYYTGLTSSLALSPIPLRFNLTFVFAASPPLSLVLDSVSDVAASPFGPSVRPDGVSFHGMLRTPASQAFQAVHGRDGANMGSIGGAGMQLCETHVSVAWVEQDLGRDLSGEILEAITIEPPRIIDEDRDALPPTDATLVVLAISVTEEEGVVQDESNLGSLFAVRDLSLSSVTLSSAFNAQEFTYEAWLDGNTAWTSVLGELPDCSIAVSVRSLPAPMQRLQLTPTDGATCLFTSAPLMMLPGINVIHVLIESADGRKQSAYTVSVRRGSIALPLNWNGMLQSSSFEHALERGLSAEVVASLSVDEQGERAYGYRSVVAGGSGLLVDLRSSAWTHSAASQSCVAPTPMTQLFLSATEQSNLLQSGGVISNAPLSPSSPARCFALSAPAGSADVVALRRGPSQRNFSNGEINGQGEVAVDWPEWLAISEDVATPASNLRVLQQLTLDPPIPFDESFQLAVLHHWMLDPANRNATDSDGLRCTPVCVRLYFRNAEQDDHAMDCITMKSCEALSASDASVPSSAGVSWSSYLSDDIGPLARRFPTVFGGDFVNASDASDGIQIMESGITWDSIRSADAGQLDAMGIVQESAPTIPAEGWSLASIELELMERGFTHLGDSAEDTVVIYAIHVTGRVSSVLSGIMALDGAAITPQFDVRTLSYFTAVQVVVPPALCTWTPQLSPRMLHAQMSISVDFIASATDPGVAVGGSVVVTFAARTDSVDSRSELWLQLPSTEDGVAPAWHRWPPMSFARVSIGFPASWPPCIVELAAVSVLLQSRWKDQAGSPVSTTIALLPSNSPLELETFSLANLTLSPLFTPHQHHYVASLFIHCLPAACNETCAASIEVELRAPDAAIIQWSFNSSALQPVAERGLVHLPLRLFPSNSSGVEDSFTLIVLVADQQNPQVHSVYRTTIATRVRYGVPPAPRCPADFESIAGTCSWSCACPSSSFLRHSDLSSITVSIDSSDAPSNSQLTLSVPLRAGVLTADSMDTRALLCIYESIPQDSRIWEYLATARDLLVNPALAMNLLGSACVHRWSDRLLVRSVLRLSSGSQLSTDDDGLVLHLGLVYGTLFPSTTANRDVRAYALGSDSLLLGDSSTRLLPCQTSFDGPAVDEPMDADATNVRVTVALTTVVGDAQLGATDATSWIVLLAWILQADPGRFVLPQHDEQLDSSGGRHFSWLLLADPINPIRSSSPRHLAARLQSMMDFACTSVPSSAAAPVSISAANPWMLSQLHHRWNCSVPLQVEAAIDPALSTSQSVFSPMLALALVCWLLSGIGALAARRFFPRRLRWWLGVCSAVTAALFQSSVFGAMSSSSPHASAESNPAFTCLLSLWALHTTGNLWAVAVNVRRERHNMILRSWLLRPASKIAVGCCAVMAIVLHPSALCVLHSRWLPCGGFDAPILRSLYPFRVLTAFPRLSHASRAVFMVHFSLPFVTLFVAIWMLAVPAAISVHQWALMLLLTSVAHAILQAACLTSRLFVIVESDVDSQHHSESHSNHSHDDGTHDVELAGLETQNQQPASAAAVTVTLHPPGDDALPPSASLSPVGVAAPHLVVHFDESDDHPSPMSPSSPEAAAAFQLHRRGEARGNADQQ